jgi:hypothetical protein
MRFDDVMAETTKISVFWHVTPCSLVGLYQHFKVTWCFNHRERRK